MKELKLVTANIILAKNIENCKAERYLKKFSNNLFNPDSIVNIIISIIDYILQDGSKWYYINSEDYIPEAKVNEPSP